MIVATQIRIIAAIILASAKSVLAHNNSDVALEVRTQTNVQYSVVPSSESLVLHNVSSRASIERDYFLEKIFRKYGSSNILTYNALQRLLNNLGLNSNDGHGHQHDHGPVKVKGEENHSSDSHHHHHHESETRDRRGVNHVDTHQPHSDHKECLDTDELLTVYHLRENKTVTVSDFLDLCPSIVVMLDKGTCQPHHEHIEISTRRSILDIPPNVWGYSCISVIIISLVGLLGVAIIPIMQQVFYNHLLQFLVALAVGALSGDAMLHLIPHALGVGEEGHDHSSDQSEKAIQNEQMKVFKGLFGLVGIYFFFMIERVVTIVTDQKRKKKEKKHLAHKNKEADVIGALAMSKISLHSLHSHVEHDCGGSTMAVHPGFQALDHYVEEAQREREEDAVIEELKKDKNLSVEETKVMIKEGKGKGHGHGHSHGEIPKGVAAIAWMVILGDGIHNFTDGLAIGASFTNSITGGISTSVAVFCHELPHEIGDFAVLLKAGMSVKQAVMYNIVSSVLSFCGMLIGIMIGNQDEATLWIFIAVGGMFLYIALVDMLPEMMHVETREGENPFCHLMFQVCGMMLGIGIMLVIALYENDIKNMLS